MRAPGGQLTTTVLACAGALAKMSEARLVADWPAAAQPGAFWYGYDDTAREVAFRVYVQLRQLASGIETRRQPPASEAQRILTQHQLAYRDLTGVLAGVRDEEFDLVPAEGEWPLRTVLQHIAMTERGFHALIHWAVARRRGGDVESIEMPAEYRDAVSDPIVETGTLAEVLRRFDALHERVLTDFAGLDAADLDAPNVWWEGYAVPVRFRLLRLDAHLREHTIQVDKTLVGIGRSPSEPERLARLIHHALGQIEGALLGADDGTLADQLAVASDIESLIALME